MFTEEIPAGLLDFAAGVFESPDVPQISIDVGYDGEQFYLFEFQFILFGTRAMELFHSISRGRTTGGSGPGGIRAGGGVRSKRGRLPEAAVEGQAAGRSEMLRCSVKGGAPFRAPVRSS